MFETTLGPASYSRLNVTTLPFRYYKSFIHLFDFSEYCKLVTSQLKGIAGVKWPQHLLLFQHPN